MFLNYDFSFTSSALLLKHKKPPKDLFSATCSVLSLNVTVGEHSESLQDFNTVSDQCFKQHAHISAPIKVQLSRSAAGWCEESLIVTSPWTRRQRERGSVISGERKALTRLGSRGQRLHMELMSCQVVLSWPDYETADVYTHWDRLTSNLWRMWGCLSCDPGRVVSLSVHFQSLCRWFALLFDCFVSVCRHFAAHCCRVVSPCRHFLASL